MAKNEMESLAKRINSYWKREDLRHARIRELVVLRAVWAEKLINLRDKVAGKRHKERVELLNMRK